MTGISPVVLSPADPLGYKASHLDFFLGTNEAQNHFQIKRHNDQSDPLQGNF